MIASSRSALYKAKGSMQKGQSPLRCVSAIERGKLLCCCAKAAAVVGYTLKLTLHMLSCTRAPGLPSLQGSTCSSTKQLVRKGKAKGTTSAFAPRLALHLFGHTPLTSLLIK
eukprot:scaffold73140_cov18-Tisochrysis_lutea.AAC.1